MTTPPRKVCWMRSCRPRSDCPIEETAEAARIRTSETETMEHLRHIECHPPVLKLREKTNSGFAVSVLGDRKSTRLNSSHVAISYAVFCLKKKNDTSAEYNAVSVRMSQFI